MDAPDGMHVDHINGDGLDNRRENLRVCSPMQNLWNSKKQTNTSGFKGVTKRASDKAFIARIRVNYKLISLGSFADPIDAAKAYDAAARAHFGEFARTNF